jgi:hypothetical protein
MVNLITMNSVRAKSSAPSRSVISKYILVIAAVATLVLVAVCFGIYSEGAFMFGNGLEIVEQTGGKIIRVPAGGNLQAAIDRARGGDTVELVPGAAYKGSFKLGNNAGTEFVTIRTAAKDEQLPPADTRLDPRRHAAILPKIVSNAHGQPAILAIDGAHHYRFIGIEFGPTIDGLYDIIQIGTTEETRPQDLPHHIEFDHVYVHGDARLGQRRGIAANGRFLKVINSYFADFKREGEESQAIAIWAADGPIEIINNYLEAAAESILFGGAKSHLGLVPGNAVVRNNWLNKPVEWRNTKWVVKNFLEVKSGQNIKIENNLMTNNWTMAQEGTALIFRTANDSGDRSISRNIEFTNNIVRGAGSAITVDGGEAGGGKDLTISNNVFEDITGKKWDGRGYFLKPASWDGLVVENNTVIHDGSITIAYGRPITRLQFRNNIVFNNEYGFFGDGVGVGKAAISRYFPGAVISNNLIVGGARSDYGDKNFYPTSLGQIDFICAGSGDYRLASGNQFLKVTGVRIGADLDPKTVGGK